MAVIVSQKIMELSQAKDPKKALIDAVDISEIETWGDNLVVATYIRPEKTAGGVYRPPSNVGEDEFQGNVGLVIQVGDGLDEDVKRDILHQWVRFGYNDGLKWRYGGVPLRDISITRLRGKVKDPGKVL